MTMEEMLKRVWKGWGNRTGCRSFKEWRDREWVRVASMFKEWKMSGEVRKLRPVFNPEKGWRVMGEVDRGRALKRGGGVYELPSGRFQVVVRREGRQIHVGVFDTLSQAEAVLVRQTNNVC